MSKQPERDNFMVRQVNKEEVVIRELFANWLRCTILSGRFEKLGVDVPMTRLDELVEAAMFKAKRWPFTDKLREMQALVLAQDARFISPQQAQDEIPDGIAYSEVAAQCAEARATDAAHGLPDTTVDTKGQSAAEQPVGETGADTPEGGTAPATSKPAKPKGSKTARAAKTNGHTDRAALTRQLLAEKID